MHCHNSFIELSTAGTVPMLVADFLPYQKLQLLSNPAWYSVCVPDRFGHAQPLALLLVWIAASACLACWWRFFQQQG